MKNGNDFNLLVARREVYGIREALKQATPDSWMNFWKLKRSGSDPLDKIIELIKESDPEAKSSALIPDGCILDVKLCLKPSDDDAHSAF